MSRQPTAPTVLDGTLPLASVVDGTAAGGELPEHRARFLAQDAVGDRDAAAGELVGPAGVNRTLVEARDLLQLGAAAGDHQRPHARPDDRAAAHRAGAP